MATFILLSTLTDDGAQTIKEDPGRILAVNQELERMGVHVVSQWAVLGPYDFVNVVEAPDIVTIARVSAVLSSRGSVKIMTLPGDPDRRVHRRAPAPRRREVAERVPSHYAICLPRTPRSRGLMRRHSS